MLQIKNIQKIYISLKGKKKFERIEIVPIRNKEKYQLRIRKCTIFELEDWYIFANTRPIIIIQTIHKIKSK